VAQFDMATALLCFRRHTSATTKVHQCVNQLHIVNAVTPRVSSRRWWLTRPNGEALPEHMTSSRAPAPESNAQNDVFEMDETTFLLGGHLRKCFRCSEAMERLATMRSRSFILHWSICMRIAKLSSLIASNRASRNNRYVQKPI
jgi:hypothetical protein